MKKALLLSLTLSLGVAAAQTTTATPTATAPTAITDVSADHWAREAVALLIRRGIIMGYPDGTFRGNGTLTRYEAAMVFARLIDTGLLNSPASPFTPEDRDVLTRGVQELRTQLATVTERTNTLTTDVDLLQQRLSAAEAALAQVISVAATRAEVDALAARVPTTAAVNAQLATKADTATVDALAARVAQLEAARPEPAPAATAPAAPTPATLPDVTFRPDPEPRLSLGGGVERGLGSGTGYNAAIEYRDAIGGLNLRGSGMLSTATQSYGLQVHAVKPFGTSATMLRPYIGAGVGMLVSPDVTTKTGVTDTYGSALLGAAYNFTDTMKLYTEVDGRYFFTTKGAATGNTADSNNRVGISVRAGVMITF